VRVADLDRDMRDVIPSGTTRDSEYLFRRMTAATLAQAAPAPGRRILDVAAGVGQDAAALRARGALAVAAEPSARMTGLAQLWAEREGLALPPWVRAWSDQLPFASGSFDAVVCKGSLDHFAQPRRALAEMARVTRSGGRVVLAVANFESAACRAAQGLDALREGWLGRPPPRGRRHYDVPHDHFTRYELDLVLEQASEWLALERPLGVSLAWGLPGWSRALAKLPEGAAEAALRALDWLARRAPRLADVVVLAGTPRRAAIASV
jgi:SAM-dependent methyltransferase